MRRFTIRNLPALSSRHTRPASIIIIFITLTALWSSGLPRACIFGQCRSRPYNYHTQDGREIDLSDPEAPFVAWPLARVCSETTWTPGLVFMCDNNSGGIGNIRSYTLTCLRYAIAAGATGLVMPTIRTRSDNNLADLFSGHRPFDYFFDKEHFQRGLHLACPQIKIYDAAADILGFGEPFKPQQITPNKYGLRGGCDRRELNKHTDLFGPRFRKWLNETAEQLKLPPVGTDYPRVIRMNWGVQWDFPVYKDGPEFVATFGGLLKFQKDILELGKRTVSAMELLATSGAGGSKQFAGFHLRTENDALSRWPDFDIQSSAYIQRAAGLGVRAAYLATGNATEADRFKTTAMSQERIQVVTKHDLLAGTRDGLKQLDSLSWDQQALVDFIVLLKSTYFMGVNPSSFSINVAGKRHLQREGLYTRPWKAGGDGDGRSWLMGNYDSYWDDWLFMYDSLWP